MTKTHQGGQESTKQVAYRKAGHRKHYLPQFKDGNWNSNCDVSRSLKNWEIEMRTEFSVFLSHSSVPQSQDHSSSLTLTPREKHVTPICLTSSSPIYRPSVFLSAHTGYQQSEAIVTHESLPPCWRHMTQLMCIRKAAWFIRHRQSSCLMISMETRILSLIPLRLGFWTFPLWHVERIWRRVQQHRYFPGKGMDLWSSQVVPE